MFVIRYDLRIPPASTLTHAGIDPCIGWESLQLVVSDVMPALAGG